MVSPSKTAEQIASTGRQIVTNRQSRNALFLVINIIVILLINSLMPLFEGGSHYTEAAEEMTYAEYVKVKEEDKHITLTYKSQLEIEVYVAKIRKQIEKQKEEDGVISNEYIEVDIPEVMPVKAYTKFFFESPSWYINTAVHTVTVVLLFYSIFNYILAKHKNTYAKYLSLEKEVDDNTNQYIDPNTFEPYMVDVFNKERKINQHKANVKFSLERLESRTSYKVRTAYKKTLTDPNINIGWYLKLRVRWYIRKRNKLLNKLTDEYIQEFVIDGRVKYFKYIHPTFVTCGINLNGRTVDTYSLMERDSTKLTKQGVPRVVRTLLFTISLALLLTLTVQSSLDKPIIWIVINATVKLAPLLMQIIFAYDYRDSFMSDQLIPNLQYRKSIIILYLAYLKNKKEEVTHNVEENK